MVFGLRLANHAILKILESQRCAHIGSPPYADLPGEIHADTGYEALGVTIVVYKDS